MMAVCMCVPMLCYRVVTYDIIVCIDNDNDRIVAVGCGYGHSALLCVVFVL